jgi:Flp pilus assembly protein TadD
MLNAEGLRMLAAILILVLAAPPHLAFGQALAAAPNASDASQAAALRTQGQAALQAGNNAGALALLKRALELDPRSPQGLRAVAGCLAG